MIEKNKGHSMSTHTLFGILLSTISDFAEIWHVCTGLDEKMSHTKFRVIKSNRF